MPPFCIDLVVTVKVGDRTTVYDALLRRRWPYALTTPGKVTLMGTPTYAIDGATTTKVPSRVNGKIYNLPPTSFLMPPPPDVDAPVDDEFSVYVEADLIHNLLHVFPREASAITVGGTAILRPQPTLANPMPAPVMIESHDNVLQGNVDLSSLEGEIEVDVGPGNVWTGSARTGIKPRRLVANLQRAFLLPTDIGEYKPLKPVGQPVEQPSPPTLPSVPPADEGSVTTATSPSPSPSASASPSDSGSPSDSDSPSEGGVTDGGSNENDLPPAPTPLPTPRPAPSPSPSPTGSGTASPAPTPQPSPFYALRTQDLTLNCPAPAEGENFTYPDSSRFRINMSCGNRWVDGRRVIFSSGYGIEMHNCILYIGGDLDLSSRESMSGETLKAPALRGVNATLIVDGTLILSNGSLDAAGVGMVIYCRRLVTAARGDYRGLIMVQEAAAICPAFPGAQLRIEGGIVCGGDSILLYASGPHGEEDPLVTRIRGVHLWSTELVYKPQYLKTLNRFGPLEIVSLRQVE